MVFVGLILILKIKNSMKRVGCEGDTPIQGRFGKGLYIIIIYFKNKNKNKSQPSPVPFHATTLPLRYKVTCPASHHAATAGV